MKLRYLAPPIVRMVSNYPLESLQHTLCAAGIESFSNPQEKYATVLAKAVSKLRIPRNISRSDDGPIFVAFMGFSEYRTLPFSFWTEIIPYCFDCWPADYERWESFFRRHRIRLAFFGARQSAAHFERQLNHMRCVWLPEATDPSEYEYAKPLPARTIDVLELGRKHDRFHSAITQQLSRLRRSHLFEKVKGEIIFPERRGLIAGLADAKISVCFPCSQTHPERSGPVETVTHRYFQSMASKCIMLGHCPAELKDLFGYNPVIEVQWGNETEQIESILNDISRFQQLVEENHARLLEVGTWTSRIPSIFENIAEILSVSLLPVKTEAETTV